MGNKKKILVVEDERPLVEAIKAKLEKNDFTVVTVGGVDQSLESLQKLKKIDAIWLDHYLLGKKNGLDLVTILKAQDGKLAKIPIFVVSNTTSPDKVQSYLKLGVSKYYVKAEHRLDEIIMEIKASLDSDTGE